MDWQRELVYVEPAEETGRSQWLGEERGSSGTLTREVRRILAGDRPNLNDVLTKRSRERFETLRADRAYTLGDHPIARPDGWFEWWTYAGDAANALLAARVEAIGRLCSAIGHYGVSVAITPDRLSAAGGWRGVSETEAVEASAIAPRLKFADLLPRALLAEIVGCRTAQAADS